EAHARHEDAVVGVEAEVEPPDARHAGVGILLVGWPQRLAAAADAGQLRYFGRGLADHLVADLAEIERAANPGTAPVVDDRQGAGGGGAEVVAPRQLGVLELERYVDREAGSRGEADAAMAGDGAPPGAA